MKIQLQCECIQIRMTQRQNLRYPSSPLRLQRQDGANERESSITERRETILFENSLKFPPLSHLASGERMLPTGTVI